jgi:integral membrane sensor domain MASE1
MFPMKHLTVAVRRQLLTYAVLPLAYVITGRLGLLLAVPPGYATAVFVPAGIAVGAMFMAGPSTLPGIFLGSLLLNGWIGYSIADQFGLVSTAAAVVIALASTIQAAIGGIVLRRAMVIPRPLIIRAIFCCCSYLRRCSA